jgi:hypothetical protein
MMWATKTTMFYDNLQLEAQHWAEPMSFTFHSDIQELISEFDSDQ